MRGLSRVFPIAFWVCTHAAVASDIEVMTQNQYLGADLTPIITAPDPLTFNAAVVSALQQIAANSTPQRMQALAEQILKRQPPLVGLQEVFAFQCTDLAPALPGQGCSDPSIAGAFNDHLQLTLNALNGSYIAEAVVINLNLVPGIPFDIGGSPALLTVIDRDVILVRSDVEASAVSFAGICPRPSADGCNYVNFAQANTLLGPINIERGFVAVDATVAGKDYRFVDTHLEQRQPDPTNPLSGFFQAAQATELIQTLLFTTPPGRSLIVVGDINSSPEDEPLLGVIIPPYMQFTDAGFTDAWTLRPGNVPGFTCCQRDDLSNHKSILDERIDVILSMELPAKVKQARVLGDEVSSKTPPPGLGLWGSDHGMVVTLLQFP